VGVGLLRSVVGLFCEWTGLVCKYGVVGVERTVGVSGRSRVDCGR
jgi:hypothetical protein